MKVINLAKHFNHTQLKLNAQRNSLEVFNSSNDLKHYLSKSSSTLPKQRKVQDDTITRENQTIATKTKKINFKTTQVQVPEGFIAQMCLLRNRSTQRQQKLKI